MNRDTKSKRIALPDNVKAWAVEFFNRITNTNNREVRNLFPWARSTNIVRDLGKSLKNAFDAKQKQSGRKTLMVRVINALLLDFWSDA